MNTGDLIRETRKKKGMSQIETAQAAGIAVNSLRLYEAGKRIPRIDVLRRIANALNVDVYTIADFDISSELIADYDNRVNLSINEHGSLFPRYVAAFDQLTDEGQQKAIERVEELAEIPRFKRTEE